MQVISVIQSKLPRSVLVKLEEMKRRWRVDSETFQRLLKRHISAQEAGDLQTNLFQNLMNYQDLQSQIHYIHTTQTGSIPQKKAYHLTKHWKRRFGRKYIFRDDKQQRSNKSSIYPDFQSHRKRLKNRWL